MKRSTEKIDKKKIMKILEKIPDPELGVSIVDLGLIYDVKFPAKGKVQIIMTLTSMGCLLFDLMKDPIVNEVSAIEGISEVYVDLTFDPPWSSDMMTEKAKLQLGFF